MSQTIVTKKPESNQIVFEREFDAPIERVFSAFTSAEALAKWWGPEGWETETKELSFTPGGRWHYGMKCLDPNQGDWYGQTSWGLSMYEMIDEPNGFTYTDYFSNEEGVIDETKPATKVDMKFETIDDKTRLTSTTTCPDKDSYETLVNMGMVEGLSQTWDRLSEMVQADN